MHQTDIDYVQRVGEEREALLKDKVFDYDYKKRTQLDVEVDLKPGSKLHEKLLQWGLQLATRAQAASTSYHQTWKKLDWTLNGFVTPEEANPNGNARNKPRNIVIPMSFEMREYFKAAMKGIFLQDPVWRMRPYPGARSVINAAAMEYVLQRQVNWFNLGLHAITSFGDMFTYGIATGGVEWRQKRGCRPVDREITVEAMKMAKAAGADVSMSDVGKIVRELREQVLYEGSALNPWDVYNTMWDPNTNPNNFQRGEFIGNIYRLNATDLLRRENDEEERRFNGWYVKMLAEKGQGFSRYNKRTDSGRADRQGTEGATHMIAPGQYTSPADFMYFELNIIPSDWEVGPETYPVKYMLEIACDRIVTAFGPLNLSHGDFGVVCGAPNTDGHNILPVSHLLVTYGIQEFIDTMARCTQALAVKNVNGGTTVFNHNVLNWDDYNNPEPAKVVRYANPHVTPEQAKYALMQFPSPDMRESHMRHMSELMGMAKEGNGLNDMIGDLPDRPGRMGVAAATQNKSSRIELIAYMIGQQFMTPLGWQFAHNQVQFGKLPIQNDLMGRFADKIAKELGSDMGRQSVAAMMHPEGGIDPMSMGLDFEMEPYTGASPVKDDVTGLGELLKTVLVNPEILAEASRGEGIFGGMLRTYSRQTGFENFDEYKASGNQAPQMMSVPDDELQKQIQAGNRVPMGAMQ